MNINKNSVSGVINNYTKQNFEELSKNLSIVDNLIKFELWLAEHFPPNTTSSTDFAWHNRVIALICTKTREDLVASLENKGKEDCCLSHLISKAEPSGLDIAQILSAIKSAPLPSTYQALVKKMQNNSHFTPQMAIEQATSQQNVLLIKALAKEMPKEVIAALTKAFENHNLKKIAFLAQVEPAAFKNALKIPVKQGTPLAWAASHGQLEIVKLIAQADFNAFEDALTKKEDHFLFNTIAYLCELDMITYMAETAPDAFKIALMIGDEEGLLPLAAAIVNENADIVNYLFEAFPELCLESLIKQPSTMTTNLEMIKCLAEKCPKAFKIALTTHTSDDSSLIHWAASHPNLDTIRYLANRHPEALTTLTHQGESLLSILKALRPETYLEAKQIIKPYYANLKQHHLALIQRKALSHAWHLDGKSSLIQADTKITVATINLEGHQPPEWFHLMSKDFPLFKKQYPALLEPYQGSLLQHLFDLGANENLYSLDDKIKRVKAGLPVIINAGYQKHAVTLLIWGDQFVICDRGGSKRPLKVYHFNPENLDEETFKKIERISCCGSRQDYKDLFFSELSQKLAFSQKNLDRQLEKAHPLPKQTVGNCSFVSPATAIYAFILLGTSRGIDEAGCLLREEKNEPLNQEKVQQAVTSYQIWLAHLQMSFLEKSLRPLEREEQAFVPDHPLIIRALRKAHLLPLDAQSEKRLEELTTAYIHCLDDKKKAELQSDLNFWKFLNKQPLL